MPEYVILMKLTHQGMKKMDECPAWTERWREGWVNYGGVWNSFHFTAGDYDCVLVGQAESDDHVAAFAMWLAQEGDVTTTTMRAWTAKQIALWAPGGEKGWPR